MAKTSTQKPMTAEGKTLFQIDITQTRYGTLFVLAESEDKAKADAEEMAYEVRSDEWDNTETDWSVAVAWLAPGDHDDVWTGGPDGRTAQWSTLVAGSSLGGVEP
ncbi:MAG: hypothetical protein KGL39_29915 [Patescibacteria group bacterium]|nr:hypothetical protein [Patescibacteria group bacterium]